LGTTIGGILVGFDQQVFKAVPPAYELVHHARPDAPVPTKDGGLVVRLRSDRRAARAEETAEADEAARADETAEADEAARADETAEADEAARADETAHAHVEGEDQAPPRE
jgi:hypothetical protein